MGPALHNIENLLCKIYLTKKGMFGKTSGIVKITITPSLTIVDIKSNKLFDCFPQKKNEKLDINVLKLWVKKNNYKVSISTGLTHLKRKLSLELNDILNSEIKLKSKTNKFDLIMIKNKIINYLNIFCTIYI